MTRRFTMECIKTGRFWHFASEGQCRRAALAIGLKDYIIGEVV